MYYAEKGKDHVLSALIVFHRITHIYFFFLFNSGEINKALLKKIS